MKIDLHMHSGYSSDGQLTPVQLAAMAKASHIDVIALSNHDQTTGVKEITAEAGKLGIEVIPAIECSTLLGEYPVHLLGYGIDPDHPYFKNLDQQIKTRNDGVFHQRVEKICKKYGITVDEASYLQDGKNPWFAFINDILQRPEIKNHPDFADYIPGGKRSDPAPVNFFWDKCQPGSDLFVEAYAPDFFESIDKIHEAGGAAVIAHPFNTFFHREDLLNQAIEKGIDGMEVYSNYHSPEQCEWYREFADKNNLMITCGSDFHGEKKPSIKMGEYGYDQDTSWIYDNLKTVISKRNRNSRK